MTYVVAVYRAVMYWFLHLNRGEWALVLLVGMSLGFLCMRGFGSRSAY